jgi:hypothetical protein
VGRPDHLDDVHALPHQGLGSICARCSSSRALHESLEGDRVEHEIVRVQLDGDRDASFTGEGVDLLSLQHLQRAVADASRASTKMGGEGLNPPLLTSTDVRARSRRLSSASWGSCRGRHAVY